MALRLTTIWREAGFFASIFTSFSLIALGFILGLLAGILLAIPAARYPLVRVLLKPYVTGKRRVADIENDMKAYFYGIYQTRGLDALEAMRQ